MGLVASWIWLAAEWSMDNLHLFARQEEPFGDVPDIAAPAVTAGSLHKLYINGEYVGRGHSPADAEGYETARRDMPRVAAAHVDM